MESFERHDFEPDEARPDLTLRVGPLRFAIRGLAADSVLIEAPSASVPRGYADIYEGDRHIARCLIVLAEPEGALLRCAFKHRTEARAEPPIDYAE